MKNILLFILLSAATQLSNAYVNEYGHNRIALMAYHFLEQCGHKSITRHYSINDIYTVVNGSTSVDTSVLPFSIYNRLFDWHFYKAEKSIENGTLTLVDTPWFLFNGTFKNPWKKLLVKYQKENDRNEKLKWLGGFAHFIEDMANPAHIIPAFHMAGVKDGIDDFKSSYYNKPPSELIFKAISKHQLHPCKVFENRYSQLQHKISISVFNQIRDNLVEVTKNELKQDIDHCPGFKWADFYSEAKEGDFFGGFHMQKLQTVFRYKNKKWQKHIVNEKVVIGYEGTLMKNNNSNMTCSFIKSAYQPFIDRLFLNAIIADAMLLKSQAKTF